MYSPTRPSLVGPVPSTQPGMRNVSRKVHQIKLTPLVFVFGQAAQAGAPGSGPATLA